MGGSIYLFKVAGIDLRMHVTFPLILIWSALQYGYLRGAGTDGAIFGVLITLLLFAIVVLHELGHSLTARRFGVQTRQIVLLPIGGVAQLERIPENPRQEFLIAIAGPAVNFALATLFYVVSMILNVPLGQALFNFLNGGQGTFNTVIAYLFIANLSLGLFNLLPAFPMDGGRILRALLATRLAYPRATSIAAVVGQGLALLLGLWGFLGGGSFLAIIVAVFIYIGAGQEAQFVQQRSVLRNLRVGQAFSRQAAALAPDDTLQRAVDLTLRSFQADFPVVQDGRVIGLLTSTDLLQALSSNNVTAPVRQVMRTDVPTATPDDDLFEVQERFSEAQISALPVVVNDQFVGMLTSRDLNEMYRLLSVNPDLLNRRPSLPTSTQL